MRRNYTEIRPQVTATKQIGTHNRILRSAWFQDWVLSNDTGLITKRDPDTVRNADVSFYSYRRIAKGPLPKDYGAEPPELVVEVRSPGDRWPKVLGKVAEYLNAGVLAVVVLDDDSRTALLAMADQAPCDLGPDDELTLPEILPGFAVPVRRFFE